MSESSNFNRLVKLLARGGSMVIKQVINKYSAPLTFSDYIYQNQGTVLKLKLTDKQKQLVAARDIHKMDITLLCKFALDLFKGQLTEKEKSCTVAIRTERDSFMHSDILEAAKLDSQEFERRWQDISFLLLDFAAETGEQSFTSQLQSFIDDTKKSDPDFQEIFDTLKEWCQSNTELGEKVDALARSVEELKGMCELIRYLVNR